MNEVSKIPDFGSFAIVSYIPDPLGAFLTAIRQLLPGDQIPQAHVTILPPRPLNIPVEAASKQARRVLQAFSSFEVELSTVQYFTETNFFYLDLSIGETVLHKLHDALNTGDLEHCEEFEFRPHVTLGGPVPAATLPSVHTQAKTLWKSAECAPRFSIREIVFLWLSPSDPRGEWRRFWSQDLEGDPTKTQSLQPAELTRRASAGATARTW